MITSTSNSTVKQIRRLRERKERQQSGQFFIEGLRIVGEAVNIHWDIDALVVAPELLTSLFGQQIVQTFQDRGGEILEVSGEVFQSLSSKDGPQGIAAVARQRWSRLETIRVLAGNWWVALDSVANPGNLGTILRTLDAVGAEGVILLDQATDPYEPETLRASMGAIFNQQIVKATFAEFSTWKKTYSVPVIGSSDKGDQDYHHLVYPDVFVLLMGSERHGLLDHHIAICDSVVAIPMVGKSDSLNLAIATSVIAYEVFNQRRDSSEAQNRGVTGSIGAA